MSRSQRSREGWSRLREGSLGVHRGARWRRSKQGLVRAPLGVAAPPGCLQSLWPQTGVTRRSVLRAQATEGSVERAVAFSFREEFCRGEDTVTAVRPQLGPRAGRSASHPLGGNTPPLHRSDKSEQTRQAPIQLHVVLALLFLGSHPKIVRASLESTGSPGAWVAQSVGRLTLDFSSGHDLTRFMGWSPGSGSVPA